MVALATPTLQHRADQLRCVAVYQPHSNDLPTCRSIGLDAAAVPCSVRLSILSPDSPHLRMMKTLLSSLDLKPEEMVSLGSVFGHLPGHRLVGLVWTLIFSLTPARSIILICFRLAMHLRLMIE